MAARRYPNGVAFPNEGFVQTSIETWFGKEHVLNTVGDADLIATHTASGEEWVIEAKGITSATGLDFNTGVGQLLRRMGNTATRYGIAGPDSPTFISHLRQIHPWVRQQLNLHWILVDETGSVRVVAPGASL